MMFTASKILWGLLAVGVSGGIVGVGYNVSNWSLLKKSKIFLELVEVENGSKKCYTFSEDYQGLKTKKFEECKEWTNSLEKSTDSSSQKIIYLRVDKNSIKEDTDDIKNLASKEREKNSMSESEQKQEEEDITCTKVVEQQMHSDSEKALFKCEFKKKDKSK